MGQRQPGGEIDAHIGWTQPWIDTILGYVTHLNSMHPTNVHMNEVETLEHIAAEKDAPEEVKTKVARLAKKIRAAQGKAARTIGKLRARK